jgi:hypothetical protein
MLRIKIKEEEKKKKKRGGGISAIKYQTVYVIFFFSGPFSRSYC